MAISQLASQIWNIKVANNESVHFVPQGQLATIFNTENVREALKEAGVQPHELARTTHVILQQAQRIFATLLDIRSVYNILRFIEVDHLQTHGLDDILPMRDKSLDFLDKETAERFYKAQWRYCVPIFSPNFQHRILEDDTILPYLNSKYVGQGAFGTVYKVELHPLHVASSNWVKRQVARKEIVATENSMANELRVLTSLTCIQHPNILELLGSYTLRDKHNFLFPLGETDLEKAYKADNRLLGFPDRTSLFLSLPGIASALEKIHAYASESLSWIGCHHDIKPNNILVMDNRLVIADFGLCSLKDASEGSRSLHRQGGHFYHAPECEDYENDCKKGSTTRAIDIWSLGCVILELLVFILKGNKGVEDFATSRKITFEQSGCTTSTFHYGRRPNPGVKKCLEELKGGDFPTIVNELASLSGAMLSIEPADRPRAGKVAARLRYLALMHVSHSTLGCLKEVDDSKLFDLVVEKQRFECWRSRIAGTWNPEQDDSALSEQAYSSAIEGVSKMGETTQSLKGGSYNIHSCVFQLQLVNDDLCKLLDNTAQQMIRLEVESHLLALCDEVKLPGGGPAGLPDPSSVNSRIGTLSALKKMHALVEVANKSGKHEFIVDRGRIYSFDPASKRSFSNARYMSENSGPHDILIQWLYYDAKWAGTQGETLFSRMESLVTFLNKASEEASLRVLPCLGYYHEESRHAFGLVFPYPKSNTEAGLEMMSLDKMFAVKSVKLRPELGRVFLLVQTLAKSLLQYHTMGWFHKSISSQHVVFFKPAKREEILNIDEPYFMGFDHSRQDKPGEYSEGPQHEETRAQYQHPLYRSGKSRFCPQFDYFSFGLLMLELGLWKSLPQLTEDNLPRTESQEEKIVLIRRDLIPHLGTRMGEVYRKACLACFDVEIGDRSHQGDCYETHRNGPLAAFRENVLEPLSRCSL